FISNPKLELQVVCTLISRLIFQNEIFIECRSVVQTKIRFTFIPNAKGELEIVGWHRLVGNDSIEKLCCDKIKPKEVFSVAYRCEVQSKIIRAPLPGCER